GLRAALLRAVVLRAAFLADDFFAADFLALDLRADFLAVDLRAAGFFAAAFLVPAFLIAMVLVAPRQLAWYSCPVIAGRSRPGPRRRAGCPSGGPAEGREPRCGCRQANALAWRTIGAAGRLPGLPRAASRCRSSSAPEAETKTPASPGRGRDVRWKGWWLRPEGRRRRSPERMPRRRHHRRW